MSTSTSKKSKEKLNEIKEQIEYYLSDKNLKQDSFFHQKITADPNGYIELDYFLKCNKIKKAGWTKEELKEGIKKSDEIELDKTENKVRRKDNRALPELTLLAKKRKKKDTDEEKEKEKKTYEEAIKDPVILMISCKEKTTISWKQINEEFKKVNPELNVIYFRFQNTEGHCAFILKENQSKDEIEFKDKFTIDKTEFTVKKCEGEDLANFWKDQGSHYELCVKSKKRKDKSKKEKASKNGNIFEKPITLGGTEYTQLSAIKNEARKIINNSKENQPLDNKEKDFVLDLLKYHKNYEEKIKDMDYITVGKSQKYGNTKCFNIVKKNKEVEDFSFQKCVENIVKKSED